MAMVFPGLLMRYVLIRVYQSYQVSNIFLGATEHQLMIDLRYYKPNIEG